MFKVGDRVVILVVENAQGNPVRGQIVSHRCILSNWGTDKREDEWEVRTDGGNRYCCSDEDIAPA